MSETLSSAQPPASAAVSEKSERLRIAWVTGGILFALMVVVVALRLDRLSEVPPGFFFDEGAHGLDALRVLQGEYAVFFPGNQGREGLIVHVVALSISFLGRTILAVRLPTALASAGTVFAVFWLGRLLFERDEGGRATPWRGLMIGGVGAGLLAVSLGQTILGRLAYRANFLPLLLCLCLALLWWGGKHRARNGGTWWRIALAGACAGLLPYTYIAARFASLLFIFFGLSFLIPLRSVTRQRVRAELPSAAIFVAVAGLVAAPILVYFALHPEHFFMRSGQISVFGPERSHGNPLGAFLVNVWDHLLAFGIRGDPNWRHNFASQPMLTPWEALFFWFGVGLAIWRWQQPAYRLLLMWLGALLLPAMLARDFAPNTLRMIGAVPAIYLLTAIGVQEAFRLLRARLRQKDVARIAILVGAVVSGLVLTRGVSTYRTYFHLWAPASETRKSHGAEWTELAQTLNALPSDVNMVYLLPQAGSNEHYGFEFLYYGEASAQVIDSILPHLSQKVVSTLAAMENLSTVRVVDWSADSSWAEDGDENIIVLLQKHGRYLGSEEYAAFRIHTYTDIALDRPWTFYEYLEPLTVHYDGGIDLCGLALGQGQEQLSTQHRLDLGQERALWVGLQWQTTPGLNADYAISLRLYNSGGEKSYQEDAVLGNPDHARTRHWSAGEAVDTLFHLNFPAELPPGEYELRLIVYDAETLIPTVEIDVWQPETVLARLQLAEPQ